MVEWCVHFLLFKEYFLVSDAYISHVNVELCVALFKLKIRALLWVQIKKVGVAAMGRFLGWCKSAMCMPWHQHPNKILIMLIHLNTRTRTPFRGLWDAVSHTKLCYN